MIILIINEGYSFLEIMEEKSIMTRKLICSWLILGLFLGGCGYYKTGTPSLSHETEIEKPVKIVASFYPMYIMALNITQGIPEVQLVNMTKPDTGCLHDYQLTPGDMKTLESAQILIINGAGMESFLQQIIKQQNNLKIIDASIDLDLIQESDQGVNPHLWVSISGAMDQVNNIGQQLAEIDPQHSSLYLANTKKYIDKLTELKTRMHQELDQIENKNVITMHGAFPYFAREFNLNVLDVIQKVPGSEPSAGELAGIINEIKYTDVSAIFIDPKDAYQSAKVIADETGIQVFQLDPGTSGPLEPGAYIRIMEKNLEVLVEALK